MKILFNIIYKILYKILLKYIFKFIYLYYYNNNIIIIKIDINKYYIIYIFY